MRVEGIGVALLTVHIENHDKHCDRCLVIASTGCSALPAPLLKENESPPANYPRNHFGFILSKSAFRSHVKPPPPHWAFDFLKASKGLLAVYTSRHHQQSIDSTIRFIKLNSDHERFEPATIRPILKALCY